MRGLTATAALLCALASPAHAQRLRRCSEIAQDTAGDLVYVACADGRVAELDRFRHVRRTWVLDGQPLGFTRLGGLLFVDVERSVRVPIEALASIASWSSVERGRVHSIDGRQVTVALAPGAVEVGDRVELGVTRPSRGLDGPRDRAHLVAPVIATDGAFALLELGFAEQASLEMYARPTRREPTASQTAPPRLRNLTQLELGAGAPLGSDGLGFAAGVIGGFGVTYHAPFEVLVRVEASPFAWTGRRAATHAYGLVGFELDALEISAGGGMTTRHDQFDILFGLAQRVRVGHEDGASLVVSAVEGAGALGWRLEGLWGRARLPVAYGVWLEVRGGGGSAGYGFGEAAVRILWTGHGRRGSFFTSFGLGALGLFASGQSFVGGYPRVDLEARF